MSHVMIMPRLAKAVPHLITVACVGKAGDDVRAEVRNIDPFKCERFVAVDSWVHAGHGTEIVSIEVGHLVVLGVNNSPTPTHLFSRETVLEIVQALAIARAQGMRDLEQQLAAHLKARLEEDLWLRRTALQRDLEDVPEEDAETRGAIQAKIVKIDWRMAEASAEVPVATRPRIDWPTIDSHVYTIFTVRFLRSCTWQAGLWGKVLR